MPSTNTYSKGYKFGQLAPTHTQCEYNKKSSLYIYILAALVWGSDSGGPVGEVEKSQGRVCVADPKLKRDG